MSCTTDSAGARPPLPGVRAFVVSEHELLADALTLQLEVAGAGAVVGRAGTLGELEAAEVTGVVQDPDVVVLGDVAGSREWTAALDVVRRCWPAVGVVVALPTPPEGETGGVDGWLTPETPVAEAIEVLRRAADATTRTTGD